MNHNKERERERKRKEGREGEGESESERGGGKGGKGGKGGRERGWGCTLVDSSVILVTVCTSSSKDVLAAQPNLLSI